MTPLRYVLTDPRDALYYYRWRLLCRLFHVHGRPCDGRMDHWPRSTVRGRWIR